MKPRSAPVQLVPLFLAGLALRPQLIGFGPLLPFIHDSFAIPHVVGGLVNSIPVLLMGIFALPAGRLVHRLGIRAAMSLSLGLLLAFGAVRALSPDVGMLVASTFGIGVGIGLAGGLLPAVVKVAVPGRAGLATGIYTIAIQLGAAVSAGVAAPLAIIVGWRGALMAFAIASALVLGAWVVSGRLIPERARTNAPAPTLPLLRPSAWHMAAIFALNSVPFYGLVTWLPTIYVERGWSETASGLLVALMNSVALPASLIVPALSDRTRQRAPYLAAAAGTLALGLLGLLQAPEAALLWVVVIGAALGSLFPLALTLPVDHGASGQEVAGLAAVTLAGGYAVASTAPMVLGWSRDATGSFDLALLILLADALALVAISLALRRPPPLMPGHAQSDAAPPAGSASPTG